MDMTNISDSKHLNLAVSQVQSDVGLTYLPDPGKMGMVCLPNPTQLDLPESQIQGDVNVAHFPNLRHLDLAVNQVQGDWMW